MYNYAKPCSPPTRVLKLAGKIYLNQDKQKVPAKFFYPVENRSTIPVRYLQTGIDLPPPALGKRTLDIVGETGSVKFEVSFSHEQRYLTIK